MMRVVLATVIAGVTVTSASAPQQSAAVPEAPQALASVRREALHAHMSFLADDQLEGRGTGTRGQEVAARYVAAQFEAFGLTPAGLDRTFYQQVPLREITADPERSQLAVVRDGKATPLVWGDGFIMRGNENDPDASVEAPVVFVGYGVVAPDRNSDDYAGIDAHGKIVATLYGAPASFPAAERAHWASAREKRRQAQLHGAVGMVTLATPDFQKILPWSRMVIGARFPAMQWIGPSGTISDAFPQLKVNASLSAAESQNIFDGAPRTWQQVLDDARNDKLRPFALAVSLRMRAVSRLREIRSPNVAAILPGSDPKLRDEYVVFTAHTDHLGIGPAINGDTIYNGALDNASGVAALLELARMFAALPKRPARSLLFVGVTAEEKGMLGSDYFAHFPTVPIASIAANINIDGMSLLYKFRDITPLGAEHSSLGPLIERDARRLGLVVSPDPNPEQVYFIRSDQYSFVRQGIPSVFLTEGEQARDPNVNGRELQQKWTATRYHSPSDDMSQPLDWDAAVEFVQIDFLVGFDVANQPDRPTWNKNDFFGTTFAARQAAGK
jgi:peptidase M28-like protein